MMSEKKILSILLACLAFSGCITRKYNYGDSEYKVYNNLKRATKHKDDVKILILVNKNLKEFPLEIIEFSNLKVLNLTNNEISKIPREIGELKNLEKLILWRNKLEEMPNEIITLRKLRRINVADNRLTENDIEFIKETLPDCLVIDAIIL